MPLHFSARIVLQDNEPKQQYLKESIAVIESLLEGYVIENGQLAGFAKITDVHFESPNFDRIIIPLPEMRQAIVDTMKQGQNSMGLDEFLMLVRGVYRANKD